MSARGSEDGEEVRWLFESGGVLLRITGYELRRFRPGALHDWLSGSVDLWLSFAVDVPGEGEQTVSQLRAYTDELSVGADELGQLRSDLELLLTGGTSRVTFAPIERDLELTVEHAEREPAIGVVMRSGLAVTSLEPRPTTLDALRRVHDDLGRVLDRFPSRG
jgi:hypothetical protein